MNNKLTVDARMLRNSGIGVYLESLIKLMPVNSEYLYLVTPSDKPFFEERGLQYRIFDEKIYSIAEQVKYRSIISKTDLFWSPHYNVPIFPVKAKYRIVTIHDAYHLANLKSLSLKQRLYAKILMQRAVKGSDKIITVSDFSKEEISKFTGCNKKKIHVIHNGTEQRAFHSNLDILRVKYLLPDKYFLFVGNVKPHKNLKVLCHAFLRLPISIQNDFKIVIVGKKDGFITGDEEIKALINNNSVLLKSIIFTGFVDSADMSSIYHYAEMFIFPSLYEGFGLPPLEAMVNSTPTICSNAASIPEICGDATLYFDPDSPESLSLKILEVLKNKDKRQNLVELGKKRVLKFTWEESLAKHLALFNL